MNTTEVTDDLKANFRSWENGCEGDAERLANILLSRHSELSYAEMLKLAMEWVGAQHDQPEEPETEPNKGITPPPLVKAYNDLETNFRGLAARPRGPGRPPRRHARRPAPGT